MNVVERHRAERSRSPFDRGARQSLHRTPDRDDDQVARPAQHARTTRHHAVHHGASSGRAATPTCSRVERALKIAIPVTCLIIALFGAPLATSTQRGGSAYGIAVSLATTMIFLLMIQLTRAIGGKGVIPPDFAAWIPGAIFGFIGLVLLARVRT